MIISICIATYRRPERLSALLNDLVNQHLLPDEVIVVDNDPEGSAYSVVQGRRELGTPFPIHYDIQPEKNISLTRNRTVARASSEWIAFIDDDERAPQGWLMQLAQSVIDFSADGALGPVEPLVPFDAPNWIQNGNFYNWARMQTGRVIPLNKLRFGNVLLRGSLLRSFPNPFDPNYGLTGGEDGDLLGRLTHQGARFVWCDEAIVYEPVEIARLSLRWLILRALRGGQDYARHRLSGSFSHLSRIGRTLFFLRALGQSLAAAVMALFCWPRGHHHAVYWLLKVAANFGKMSIFLGWHYREYGVEVT